MRWPKLTLGDSVLVYWDDTAAHGTDGWATDEEIHAASTPSQQVTSGLFFELNQHAFVLVRTFDRDPEATTKEGGFQIPRGCVTDVIRTMDAKHVLAGRKRKK